ncbi:MAG: cytochrome C oxidase subunit I, partial [Anaerolineae bacterium]|nr:cytochrome C oxidase subunit I [Anaerolineae bacterium]
MAVSSISSVVEDVYAIHPEKRLTLFFLVTGLVALLVGALLGPLQALNYAGVDLYKNFPFL